MTSLLRGKSLGGGIALAFAAQGAAVLSNMFVSLVVARRLPVEDFAYWQLFTFYLSFAELSALGLNQGVYLRCAGKEIAQGDKSLLSGQFRLLALHSLLCGGIMLSFLALAPVGENRKMVLCGVAAGLVLVNLSGFMGGLFQAMGQTRLYSAGLLLGRLLFLSLSMGAMAAGAASFRPFLVCWLAAQGMATGACVLAGRRVVLAKRAPVAETAKEAAVNSKAGLPLLFAALLGGLVPGAARFVVDGSLGILAFGQFSFALALVNLLGQFIAQIGMVLFPALKTSGQQALCLHYRRIDLLLHLALPLPLLLYAPFCAVLVRWLPGYAQSFSLLGLLLPLCLFDGKTQVLHATYLKVYRQEKKILAVNAAAFGVSLSLCTAAMAWGARAEYAVLALVAASVFRSCLSRRQAAPLVGQCRAEPPAHLLLALVFMGGTWFLPGVLAFGAYFSACVILYAANRAKLGQIAEWWRERPWTA